MNPKDFLTVVYNTLYVFAQWLWLGRLLRL